MTPDESTARNPLGAVGSYFIENFRLLREERGLGYAELSARLEKETGRLIPPLGLSRIEKGRRRIDVDDLVALAVVLRVNPTALLLPRQGAPDQVTDLTPKQSYPLRVLWTWADGRAPLPSRGDGVTWREVLDFASHARPENDPEISGRLSADALASMQARYGYTDADPAEGAGS